VSRHELKTWPLYWQQVHDGAKTFELRKDDRGFRVGDDLVLREFDSKDGYTGNALTVRVTYICRDVPEFGLEPGYCILGISKRIA
jgi:hypothetical protein